MLVTGCASPAPISGHRGSGTGRPTTPRLKNNTALRHNNHKGSNKLIITSISSPSSPNNNSKPTTTTSSSSARNSKTGDGVEYNGGAGDAMGGFIRSSHHHLKAPSAPLSSVVHHSESSFTERFSTMLDHCQKKIRLLQGPSALFTNLVTKARRKERESPAAEQEHKLYLEEAVLERKIPETDLRQLVELPPGLGYHEWLASHTIDFFQHINLVYGTIAEFCTMSGCADMSGPATRPYLWFDEKGKKVRVAAPQYIDYVMTFTQKTINDETIFPTKFENDFPVSFESIVKKIHRLLFHVIAHLYHSHFRELVLLSLHAHLNCIFAHFTLFNERFRLIDEKETEILHDLVLALRLHPEDRAKAAEEGARRSAAGEGEGSEGEGRASPAVGATPDTSVADEPQSTQTGLDDHPLTYTEAPPPTSSTGVTAPFISPSLPDTRA